MNAAVTPQANYRNLALPLCLFSLTFFNACILLFLWFLSGTIQSWLDSAASFPTAEVLTGPIPGLFTCGFILMVSLIGAFLLLREMKAQSFTRTAGIPFCILSFTVGVSAVLFITPSGYPGQFHNQITIYSGVILLCGFMLLPYGADFLMRGFWGPGFDRIQREIHLAGIFGLVVSTGLVIIIMLLTSTWIEDFIPVLFIILIFCIVHVFIVMPVIGIELFRTGISFLEEPSCED